MIDNKKIIQDKVLVLENLILVWRRGGMSDVAFADRLQGYADTVQNAIKASALLEVYSK